MATVCLLGHPAPGHVNPLLPIVREIVARGSRVLFFATPPLAGRIEAAGADFVSYGDHALFERSLAEGGILGGMSGLLESAEAVLPATLRRVRDLDPDYLLLEAHSLVGNLLAQLVDVPAATLCSMFAINDRLITPRELLGHLYGSAPREAALTGLRALARYHETARRLAVACGVRCPDLIDYLANHQPLNIVLTSHAFQVGAETFDDSYRFVGVTPPAPDPAGRELLDQFDGRPLIYLSMGTMYNDEAGLYRASFEAFGDGPYQVVLSIGHRIDPSALPTPPGNFLVRPHVPQVAVLSRARVFITHGGINSAHEAMLQGVPLVVLPLAADHHIVAQQVAAVGAGVVLDRTGVTVDRLKALVTEVLDTPSFATRSRAIGDSLRAAGGARAAADHIEAYVARARAERICH